MVLKQNVKYQVSLQLRAEINSLFAQFAGALFARLLLKTLVRLINSRLKYPY